ncbi:phage holin family protein [Arthrobacter sp.]|uniref:phage holin family protein n=1 Tax=unclassified Arthrobacter TaxID=235627 RepID=UPI002590D7E4|nr:phage holin family protein [Arthrobacter sp.]
MAKFLLRLAINAFSLWVATWLLPGLTLSTGAAQDLVAGAAPSAPADTLGSILAYLFIGLIFAVVNAWIRPVVRFLALPVTVLTLGLFTLVINAAMLYLTSWLSGFTPVHLGIDTFFWTAVLGALIISIISLITDRLFDRDRDR